MVEWDAEGGSYSAIPQKLVVGGNLVEDGKVRVKVGPKVHSATILKKGELRASCSAETHI